MNNCLQKFAGNFQKMHPRKKRSDFAKQVLFLSLFAMLSLMGKAQTVVTGSVSDSSGVPLQRVTVIADQSKKTVLTDKSGNYSIPVMQRIKILRFHL